MILYRQPSAADCEGILDLIVDAFGHDRAREPAVRASVADDPDYGPDRCFIAVGEGGRIVGHVAAMETAVSLGGTWLPIGRLGTVCTDAECRRQGIGRQLVEQGAALVEHLGAVFLNPAPEAYVRRFYESMGFVAAVRSPSIYQVEASRLRGHASHPIRPARPADLPTLADLYQRHYGHQPGTLARSETWWARRVEGRPMLWSPLTPAYQVAERDGRVVAYVASVPDDGFRVWEWAAEPGAQAEALALLGHVAATAGPFFTVHITPYDPLFAALRAAQPVDASPEPSPLMVRAANLAVLEPVLAGLLDDAGGALHLRGHAVEVAVPDAGLSCSWSHLLALAYDGHPLDEWADDGTITVTPDTDDAREAVAEVLPPRLASRRTTDAF